MIKRLIILYNKLTGVVKVFYYNSAQSLNNSGIWQVSFNSANNALNSIMDFAYADDATENITKAQISNITSVPSKGFGYGWNCFVFDITYDPTSTNLRLNIAPYNSSTAQISMKGAYDFNSEGLIVTRVEKNNLQGYVNQGAKDAGKSVGKWVSDPQKGGKFIKNSDLKKALAGIATGGVSSIIKAGASSLFGSIIGRANKVNTTEQDIRLSTHGTAEFTGSINSVDNGLIAALSSVDFSSSKLGFVPGVWSLSAQPTITFDRYSNVEPTVISDRFERCDVEIFTPAYTLSYNVKINPDLLAGPNPLIEGYKHSAEIVRYECYNGGRIPNYKGGESKTINSKDILFDSRNNAATSEDEKRKDATLILKNSLSFSFLYPGNTSMTQWDWGNKVHQIAQDHVVRINLELYTRNEGKRDTIYFTRSYVPNYKFKK